MEWAFQVQPMFIHKYFWLKDESTLNILNLKFKRKYTSNRNSLVEHELEWCSNVEFDKRIFVFISHRISSSNRNNSFPLFFLIKWNVPRKKQRNKTKRNKIKISINIHEYASHSRVGYSDKLHISFRFKECTLVSCFVFNCKWSHRSICQY